MVKKANVVYVTLAEHYHLINPDKIYSQSTKLLGNTVLTNYQNGDNCSQATPVIED